MREKKVSVPHPFQYVKKCDYFKNFLNFKHLKEIRETLVPLEH